MRTYSTPQSALNGEITKLAIIECFVSVVAYVSAGIYLGTFKYLALAVVFAPLMLFRTEASADWGLEVFAKWLERILRLPEPVSVVGLLVLGPLIGVLIRLVATIYWAIRRPFQTLAQTPENWVRQTLCTDLLHPPEIIPLEALKGDPSRVLIFSDAVGTLRKRESFALKMLWALILLPTLVIGYLPSIIYRVSFKATALAYGPFIWVASTTLQNPLSVKTRLERITKGEIEKVRRGFSAIILTTMVAKVALVFNWVDRSYIEAKFPSQRIVASFVVLDGWPWWQLTLAFDALLTFFMLFFADAALARIEDQKAWQNEFVLKTITTSSFLRATLSILTISHFFYVALLAIAPNPIARLLTP